MKLARSFAVGSSILVLMNATIVACSSDNPPAAGGESSSSGGFDSGPKGDGSLADGGDGNPANSDAPFIIDSSIDQTGNNGFVCLEDKPMPTDGGVAPADDCTSSATCATYCQHIHDHYKLGVSQYAIACIRKLPNCSNSSDVAVCVDQATSRACKDPTSPTYCGPLVVPCDPNAGGSGAIISEAACEAIGNATNASGRSTFASCIQTKIDAGNCPSEVIKCTEQIRL